MIDVHNRWIATRLDADGAGPGAAEVTQQFVYDGSQIALALNGEGQVTNRYLWGPAVDMLLADERANAAAGESEVRWALGDHLNSVRNLAVWDEALQQTVLANQRQWSAFGELALEANPSAAAGTSPVETSLFGFTGLPFDSRTGLQNNRARWLDPATHTFLSPDPIADDPHNSYRYVGNSPTFKTDPFGLAEVRIVGGRAHVYLPGETGSSIALGDWDRTTGRVTFYNSGESESEDLALVREALRSYGYSYGESTRATVDDHLWAMKARVREKFSRPPPIPPSDTPPAPAAPTPGSALATEIVGGASRGALPTPPPQNGVAGMANGPQLSLDEARKALAEIIVAGNTILDTPGDFITMPTAARLEIAKEGYIGLAQAAAIAPLVMIAAPLYSATTLSGYAVNPQQAFQDLNSLPQNMWHSAGAFFDSDPRSQMRVLGISLGTAVVSTASVWWLNRGSGAAASALPTNPLVARILGKFNLYPQVIDPRTGRHIPFPIGINTTAHGQGHLQRMR